MTLSQRDIYSVQMPLNFPNFSTDGSSTRRKNIPKKSKRIDFNWPEINDESREFKINKTYGSEGYQKVFGWIVKRMIPAVSVGLIYGRSQSFKTFQIVDQCCRVANGLDYCGNPTKKGLVYIIAAEGGAGISKRIRAWELVNNTTVGSNLIVVPHSVFPTTDVQREALISDIKAECEKQNQCVALVVLDTMSQCANGANENDAGEVSKYLNQCRKISASVNCTVINVHHTKKDSDDFRGSSTIEGNLDFMLAVKRKTGSPEKLTTVKLHKMKEGSTDYRWDLALDEVEIDAVDDDGNPVKTLCVSSVKQFHVGDNSNGVREKVLRQYEKDAEWILNLLKREASGSLPQKQVIVAMNFAFGHAKNIAMRVSRAKDHLQELSLIESENQDGDVLLCLPKTQISDLPIA